MRKPRPASSAKPWGYFARQPILPQRAVANPGTKGRAAANRGQSPRPPTKRPSTRTSLVLRGAVATCPGHLDETMRAQHRRKAWIRNGHRLRIAGTYNPDPSAGCSRHLIDDYRIALLALLVGCGTPVIAPRTEPLRPHGARRRQAQ